MGFRHKYKIEINAADLFALRSRLRAVLEPDTHAVDGRYLIRSLYFDSPTDRALREKIDGVNRREVTFHGAGHLLVRPAGQEASGVHPMWKTGRKQLYKHA